MSILSFLQKMFDPVPGTIPLGANFDTRPADVVAQDPHISETVASAVAVDWVEMKPEDIRVFGTQDQHSKCDCVAESRRKLKRIMLYVNKGLTLDFSAAALYRKRSNYPGSGMIAADAIMLDNTFGMTLDALVPSDQLINESAANSLKVEPFNEDVSKVFRISTTDIKFNPGDLESPAGTIQKTRKGVMMWFYFTDAEWSQEVPQILVPGLTLNDSRSLHHSVVGVEPALYNGVKGIWIDDSAHFGGLARRFITEAFYKKRNWWASYPMSFQFEPQTTNRPVYIENNIVSLQQCLKYEGVFPINVDTTGVFGSITTQAVKDFQKKYGLEQVGTVGPLTKAKLKELYPTQ